MEMHSATSTAREKWVEAGLRALAAGGPEAVRVEALARTLGVSKGGFYWQFRDRGARLEALLDQWERVMVDRVIAQLDAEGGDARRRLRGLFALAASSREWLRVEPAVRDWVRRDKTVAARLRRVDNRRLDYLRSLFVALSDEEEDVEARCALAMSLFVGFRFIAADFGTRSRREVIELAAQRLLA